MTSKQPSSATSKASGAKAGKARSAKSQATKATKATTAKAAKKPPASAAARKAAADKEESAASDRSKATAAEQMTPSAGSSPSKKSRAAEGLPIKMMNDRILVSLSDDDGERRSGGGILIPATAQVGKRLAWAEVVAAGPNARTMELGDRVLFNPEDRYEVELQGLEYIILRERDIHAVAAPRLEDSGHGLYL